MSIKKTLGRVGIILAVTATIAIGQTSASVKIGNQTWTKQNLNVETPDSWCYDNNPANCAKYGRLYTWEAAKSACASRGGRWRLPTRADWDALVNKAGGGSVAGKALKSTSGWNNDGNGTNSFGFSALPGGYRFSNGYFNHAGDSGDWWSAAENGSDGAYGPVRVLRQRLREREHVRQE